MHTWIGFGLDLVDMFYINMKSLRINLLEKIDPWCHEVYIIHAFNKKLNLSEIALQKKTLTANGQGLLCWILFYLIFSNIR